MLNTKYPEHWLPNANYENLTEGLGLDGDLYKSALETAKNCDAEGLKVLIQEFSEAKRSIEDQYLVLRKRNRLMLAALYEALKEKETDNV